MALAVIIAFVVKTGRRDALPYIHAGWIAAVALGGATAGGDAGAGDLRRQPRTDRGRGGAAGGRDAAVRRLLG
nr:hypothetical protein [Ramlibacter lithotrophicus]